MQQRTPRRNGRTGFRTVTARIWRARSVIGACIVACGAASAPAAKKPQGPPPAISHLFPAGGRAGSAFPCTIGGTLAKAETRVWADHEGIVFRPTAKPDVFDVALAPDVPPGAHLVRFYNEAGGSAPRVFVVGRYEEVSDAGSNDDFRVAQKLAGIPLTVNGVLEKAGDTDTFAFNAVAGRWIVLDLQGYALGSQMDPAMKLLDGRGVEIGMSHDTHNLDPRIAWEVKKSGTYFVQVMAFAHPPAADVTLKGGGGHVYRLTITDRPYARAGWPCAVPRGAQAKWKPIGWNYGAKMEGPETGADAGGTAGGDELLRVPTTNGELVLASVVDAPVSVETEPNNDAAKAQRITPPAAICGRIDAPRDEDRFIFTAKKGENHEIRLRAFALHSPLDAWVRIEDAQGKTLQQSDDSGEGDFDPSLRWRAPADGDYIVAVGDLFDRGGWEFVHVLEVSSPRPRVSAVLPADAFKLEAGKTAEVKLTAKVAGEFKGKLQARFAALPPGVTAKEAEVPAKGGEIKLTLAAATDALAANQPVEVLIASSAPDAPRTWKAKFDMRGVEPRGDRLVNEDSRAWLTVVGGAAEAPVPAPPPASPAKK